MKIKSHYGKRLKLSCHRKMQGCCLNVIPATRREFLKEYSEELDYVSRMGADISEGYLWKMKKYPLRCPACGHSLQTYIACLASSDVLELGCIHCEYEYPVHFFKPGFTWSHVYEENTLGTSGGDSDEK